jgi:hypothetical protein
VYHFSIKGAAEVGLTVEPAGEIGASPAVPAPSGPVPENCYTADQISGHSGHEPVASLLPSSDLRKGSGGGSPPSGEPCRATRSEEELGPSRIGSETIAAKYN